MAVYNPGTDSASMAISTRDNLNRGKWFSELQTYQRYPWCEIVMNEGIAKTAPGKKLTFRSSDDPGLPKARTGLYNTYSADKHVSLYEGFMYWRNGEELFGIDKRESVMNSGEALVVSEEEVGMQAMYQRVCDSIEDASSTIASSTDTLQEQGIPYFINCPSDASGADGANNGFQGTVPAGHTLVCGLNPTTTATKYRNYADLFTDFVYDEFTVKASDLMRAINFDPPPRGKSEGSAWDGMRVYMGDRTLTAYEAMMLTGNDNLGRDGLPFFNNAVLKGITPTALPVLDAKATAGSFPIYYVNHRYLYPVFLPDYRFKEIGPEKTPMSHQVHWGIFWTYNWIAESRRRLGVMAKSAPFSEAAHGL